MGKNFVQAMNRDTVVADRRLAVLQNTKRLRFFKDLFFIMETLLMTFTQSKVKFHSPYPLLPRIKLSITKAK